MFLLFLLIEYIAIERNIMKIEIEVCDQCKKPGNRGDELRKCPCCKITDNHASCLHTFATVTVCEKCWYKAVKIEEEINDLYRNYKKTVRGMINEI